MIFEFERDFAGTLRCIPMIVRFNLDLCGIKLSLKQWSRMGRESRGEFVALPCGTPDEIETCKDSLVAATRDQARGEPKLIEIEMSLQWKSQTRVPEQIREFVTLKELPLIDLADWTSPSDLQKFALYKLTKASHDNDNFEPAMREFGVLR
ncbi:MAG: nitrate reductase associated protein [Parvibaculaceae bacterium]